MMKLHQFHLSGNCYKVRLCAHMLSLPLLLVDVDMMGGETRRAPFLAKNPNGRVPLLELEDGRTLPESNAILFFLAEGTHLVPSDRWQRAQMLQWLFFEQYSHEPYIAVARFWLKFAPEEQLRDKRHLLPEWQTKGNAALGVMETWLGNKPWFAGDEFSIADIALFAYTHCAGDGGFDVSVFPAIEDWLARVKAQPSFIPMEHRPQ
ncbi:MAG: glutathione S-transferase family protein [Alphaproteobacteria bacterium]|nr:glutathione S-transferase family protein [Alphaproteobacteria bacterium]